MSYSEFCEYDEDLMKFMNSITKNVETQLKFNRVVAEKLDLNHAVGQPLEKPAGKTDVLEDVAFG